MKKKTLIILLIIPFVIALLTFVSVIALTNNVGIDPRIIWNYRDSEGFKINGEYKLEATLEYDQNQLLKPGSDSLVWEFQSEVDPNIATINKKDDGYYLKTGSQTGEAVIICRTENRRVSYQMKAYIYDKGLVLINPINQGSGTQIDPTRYYGEYDITYSDDLSSSSLQKNNAKIPLDIEVFSDGGDDSYVVLEKSNNISFDEANNTITVNSEGESYLTLGAKGETYIESTYSFEVVNEGINVYSFNDLMMCTNKSSTGEIVVMQVNLESRENALNKDSNGNFINEYKKSNTKLFGNYDFKNETFNYNDFLYLQKPKIETKFINQFLEKTANEQNFNYTTEIKVGIRVQKNFYGNGFTINIHDLAYPIHGEKNGIDPLLKKIVPDREKDYFFGPLTFVSIGDLENAPVVRAYLCDNVGVLLDGNNLTINDAKLSNSNNISNMYNLGFTGTVLEVQGTNNTISNCVIQNGRTCLRAFSADGLLVDNCLLQNAGEFIVKLGSNKVNPTDHNKRIKFDNPLASVDSSFSEFFDSSVETNGSADYLFSSLFESSKLSYDDANNAKYILDEIQKGLDNYSGIIKDDGSINYDSHVTINDTYFYNSGIYSIAFESSFNGAYLYNGMPSLVKRLATIFGITPSDIGGTSYPVELTLTGDTRFYDWKDVDSIDSSSLIESNFAAYIGQLGGSSSELSNLSIDSFFPMKAILKQYCINNGLVYTETDTDNKAHYYVNRPVAWYGGGYNGSKLINNIDNNEYYSFSDNIEVDIASDILHGTNVPWSNELLSMSTLAKCVLAAIGSHPFQFITNGKISNNEKPILFDEVPSYLDLSSRFVG